MIQKKILTGTSPSPEIVKYCKERGYCEILATLFTNRGLHHIHEIESYLKSVLSELSNPFSLSDMKKAVGRIYEAVLKSEKILAFVDYDADGVCSGALLMRYLQHIGANIEYYVPNRIYEGYGLEAHHIVNHAIPENFDLIITADCGISSFDAISMAQASGIDVIVTDHHEVGEGMPDAFAVVNPKRPDDKSGLSNLAGCGVVFFLLAGLQMHLRKNKFFLDRKISEYDLKSLFQIVAIGTVADCVPLLGDNRTIVKAGIEMMKERIVFPGLSALFEISDLDNTRLTSTDISFKLAPRINAASRMSDASLAIELLLCSDSKTAQKFAVELDGLNDERKKISTTVFERIESEIDSNPEVWGTKKIFIFIVEEETAGLLGLIAGKITEKYCKPCIIICREDEICKGSMRSIPGFSAHELFLRFSGYLEAAGGHELAGGFSVHLDKLNDFWDAVESYAEEVLTDEIMLPTVTVDCAIDFAEITDKFMDQIALLEPFGQGNTVPAFVSHHIHSSGNRILQGKHRKMFLEQPGSESDKTFDAIFFNSEGGNDSPGDDFKAVAYQLGWNYWKGRKTLQMQVLHVDGL